MSLALACAFGLGCSGEGEGRPDEQLGNLVISPVAVSPQVDLNEASSDAMAFLHAAQLPHSWVGDKLGAHVVRASSSVKVSEGAATVEELSDALVLDLDGEDRFAATLDNSMDYGRHAIFDGSRLYLRPRYGLYHARAPQSESEAAEIRNEMYGVSGDYLELLAKQLEVRDGGAASEGGRAVHKVTLALAPQPLSSSPETLEQRKWRDSIKVASLEGSALIDVETGAVLQLAFHGGISFVRDARQFTMELQAERTIGELGHSRAIAAPAEELQMQIPPRRRELSERDALLDRIAPPARKAPTPSLTGDAE